MLAESHSSERVQREQVNEKELADRKGSAAAVEPVRSDGARLVFFSGRWLDAA